MGIIGRRVGGLVTEGSHRGCNWKHKVNDKVQVSRHPPVKGRTVLHGRHAKASLNLRGGTRLQDTLVGVGQAASIT